MFIVSAACLCSRCCVLHGCPSCRRCCLCCSLCSRSRPHTGAWASRRCPSRCALRCSGSSALRSTASPTDPSPGRPATTASSSPPSTPASGPPAWRTSSPTPGVRGRGGSGVTSDLFCFTSCLFGSACLYIQ